MNEILQYYLVFSITTAIVGLINIFHPLMEVLKDVRPTHNMVDYKFISYTTFFCLMILTAPIVFLMVLIPSMTEAFKDSMLETIMVEE